MKQQAHVVGLGLSTPCATTKKPHCACSSGGLQHQQQQQHQQQSPRRAVCAAVGSSSSRVRSVQRAQLHLQAAPEVPSAVQQQQQQQLRVQQPPHQQQQQVVQRHQLQLQAHRQHHHGHEQQQQQQAGPWRQPFTDWPMLQQRLQMQQGRQDSSMLPRPPAAADSSRANSSHVAAGYSGGQQQSIISNSSSGTSGAVGDTGINSGSNASSSSSSNASSRTENSSNSVSGSDQSSNSSSSTTRTTVGSSKAWGSLQRPVRPALDPGTAQQVVQHRPSQQQQKQLGPERGQQQQQQQQKPQHLLTWRGQRSLKLQPPTEQPQQGYQQEQQQQQLEGPTAAAEEQQSIVQQLATPIQDSVQQQAPQQQQQQQQQYLTSPVSFVAAKTHPKRLAGSLAASFGIHNHQLVFASGTLALANALKGLATVRGMVAGADGAPPYNILMQPTIRSRAAGRNSYALDIAKVGHLPLRLSDNTFDSDPAAAAHSAKLHITSSSNEHTAARNLVDNMPRRVQTVLRVAGPYAIETAVLAVALARPMMVAAWGHDLAVLVRWSANKAYNGSKTGLLLSVFRCAVDSFPPDVETEPLTGVVGHNSAS